MLESTVPVRREQQGQVPDTREEGRTLIPAVDIFEKEEGLVVVADLPGVEKEDVDVHVENSILTLKARSKSHMPVEPVYREYELLNFFRQFQLSEAVDQDKIHAEMRHGVLVIQLPKKEAAKPRQIEVKVS